MNNSLYIYVRFKYRKYIHISYNIHSIILVISISISVIIQQPKNNSKYIIISISENIPISTIVSLCLSLFLSLSSSFIILLVSRGIVSSIAEAGCSCCVWKYLQYLADDTRNAEGEDKRRKGRRRKLEVDDKFPGIEPSAGFSKHRRVGFGRIAIASGNWRTFPREFGWGWRGGGGYRSSFASESVSD